MPGGMCTLQINSLQSEQQIARFCDGTTASEALCLVANLVDLVASNDGMARASEADIRNVALVLTRLLQRCGDYVCPTGDVGSVRVLPEYEIVWRLNGNDRSWLLFGRC
eukprot:m.1520644 g.1520644  ORF g.1520644 m.1520644 type:complete len:109 (+) comp25228_c0_seq12:1607-1933(+)